MIFKPNLKHKETAQESLSGFFMSVINSLSNNHVISVVYSIGLNH